MFFKVGDILLKMSIYCVIENYVYKIDECIGCGVIGDVYKGVYKVNVDIKYFYFQFYLKFKLNFVFKIQYMYILVWFSYF